MDRYALLLVSMSLGDAKQLLGFPPEVEPSAAEIQKAYRELAFKNHPDRGGDPTKMVELNVAKDILEGKQRPTYERGGPEPSPRPQGPPREPPKPQVITFEEAKSAAGVPSGVAWVFVTDVASSGYSSDEVMRKTHGYVFYGRTDSKHVFVGVEHLAKEDFYVGGGPKVSLWSMKVFDYPRHEGEIIQPAWLYGNIVKAFKGFQWVEKRFNSKVMALPDGWHFSEKIPHTNAKPISLKHFLVNQGEIAPDDPRVVSRKNTVELKVESKGSLYSYSQHSTGPKEPPVLVLNVNGKDHKLSPSDGGKFYEVYPRDVLGYIFGTYYYDGSRKTLTRLAPAKKKKFFEWMLKKLTDLPADVRQVLEVEAAK